MEAFRKYLVPSKIALVALSSLIIGCVNNSMAAKDEQRLVREYNCMVIKVIDGDTIKTTCDQKNIRMAGIDTPEKFHRKIKDCYADEASVRAEYLLLKQYVRLEKLGVDTTGKRETAIVYIAGSKGEKVNVNVKMVEEGYAFAWTDFKNIPQGLKKQLLEVQEQARSNKVGIWNKDESGCEVIRKKTKGGYRYAVKPF
jgi:endonuclease YncB( thermonuclease family)